MKILDGTVMLATGCILDKLANKLIAPQIRFLV